MSFADDVRANAAFVNDGNPFYLQLMKLQEEAGEVASAWIGYVGNPRPEKRATRADVIKELCDVALGSMVALENLGEDSADRIAERAAVVRARFEALR